RTQASSSPGLRGLAGAPGAGAGRSGGGAVGSWTGIGHGGEASAGAGGTGGGVGAGAGWAAGTVGGAGVEARAVDCSSGCVSAGFGSACVGEPTVACAAALSTSSVVVPTLILSPGWR